MSNTERISDLQHAIEWIEDGADMDGNISNVPTPFRGYVERYLGEIALRTMEQLTTLYNADEIDSYKLAPFAEIRFILDGNNYRHNNLHVDLRCALSDMAYHISYAAEFVQDELNALTEDELAN